MEVVGAVAERVSDAAVPARETRARPDGGMNRSVAASGAWPSHPPRVTSARRVVGSARVDIGIDPF
jgi:hypothetical protein